MNRNRVTETEEFGWNLNVRKFEQRVQAESNTETF